MDTVSDPELDVRLALWVFLGLLPIDFALIGLDLLHLQADAGRAPTGFKNLMFDMHVELGAAESFEYLKSAVTALAIGLLARRQRAPILWVLCALNTWMVLDNALAIHERLGMSLARHLLQGLTLGLNRSRDLGELMAFAAAGGGFLVLLALSWRTAAPRARRAAMVLSAAPLGAALFGVGVDALHSSPWAKGLDVLAGVIEDGGESIMISLGCALGVGCYAAGRLKAGDPVVRAA